MRNDHCLLIMLGGRGPGSVALFSIIAFDRRRNSCSQHWPEHATPSSGLDEQTSGPALR